MKIPQIILQNSLLSKEIHEKTTFKSSFERDSKSWLGIFNQHLVKLVYFYNCYACPFFFGIPCFRCYGCTFLLLFLQEFLIKKMEKNKRKKHIDLMWFDKMSLSTEQDWRLSLHQKLGLQENGIYINPHYTPLVPLYFTSAFALSSPYMSFTQYEPHTTTLSFGNYI